MPSQKGRDFLLKIGNGANPEVFSVIGAARTNQMQINNNPVDSTSMDSQGVQTMIGDAGVQTMEITIDGLFKDETAEQTLRTAAFDRQSMAYQLAFPNGDMYEANFIIQDYTRGGTYDGLETFSATFVRNGAGTYSAAV